MKLYVYKAKLDGAWIINSNIELLIAISVYVSHRCKLYKIIIALYYLYYISRALIVILCYTDYLTLTNTKFELRYHNILFYMVTMSCPVHSFMRTFLIMTPVFLTTCYVQNSYESNLYARMHEHLPPELQAEVPAGFNVLNSVRNMSLITFCFFFRSVPAEFTGIDCTD